MKHLFLTVVGACALLLITQDCPGVPSNQRYLTDVIKITLRSGPGTDHKISNMLTVGQPLEILEEGQDWTLVKTSAGQEGWVLTRFVATQKPNRLLLKELRRDYDDIFEKYGQVQEQQQVLAEANEKLKDRVGNSTEEAKNKIGLLLRENEELKAAARITHRLFWAFLAGAGVFLCGIYAGYRGKKSKRRSYF